MGRRKNKNKNKEVDLFEFEIEPLQINVEDNIDEPYINSREPEPCNPNPKLKPIDTMENESIKQYNNKYSLIDKHNDVVLFVNKYFSKINSYSNIDDLEIILDKDIIESNDNGFDY